MEPAEIERIARAAGKEAAKEVFNQQMRVLGIDMNDQKQINNWHDTWAWADRGRVASDNVTPWIRKTVITTVVGVIVSGALYVGYHLIVFASSLTGAPR